MIEFKDVSLCLNNKQILTDLSFKIESSETVLLVGSSGAGKSTILRLIVRLLCPTSGQILVNGKDINKLHKNEMNELRKMFGLVFQGGALFDSLTVEENIAFFLIENVGLSWKESHSRAVEIASLLGLEEHLNYYPAEISGGMQKRVGIARAIVSQPQVLLYDEPTAGLDPLAAGNVVTIINDLQQRFNVTSLIVTHEIHHFENKVDRLLMLKNGTITYDGVMDLSILDHFEVKQQNLQCKPGEEEYGIIQ